MKVPLSWLKEYLPTKLSDNEIAETLTTVGLEFEGSKEGVMEIALTPNLSYCANIRGMARELSAVTGEKVHHPKYAVVENLSESIDKRVSIAVENRQGCPRYACRLITGVRVAPSPSWLKERIEQCGMRSVNNVVDITNLVLLELGQPLHAFDFDRLEEHRVVVRNARKGETITTLDGKLHYPTLETLLICDGKKPVAIAGIMGSLESETSEQTQTVLLESAYFEPTQIRKTAKRMDLHSDSSYRFERGCDPNGVIEALDRATAWICEIAGGVSLKGSLDIHEHDFPPKKLSCRLSRTNQLLGTPLAMNEVEGIFRRLNFGVEHLGEDKITLSIPTYRHDIQQEIDLIEEVARLYGYNNLHQKEAPLYRTGELPDSAEYLFTRKVRTLLVGVGLQECLTCDLISPAQSALISSDIFPSRTLIKLLNPRSVDQSIMRPSLLPGLLTVVKQNEAYGSESIAGFEVGRVHFNDKGRYLEPPVVGIILTGARNPFHWETKEGSVDFFDLKGIVENLFLQLKVIPTFSHSHYANFHPGRQAAISLSSPTNFHPGREAGMGKIEVGVMGEVHPLTLKGADLSRPVYYAEIDLQEIQQFLSKELRMEPLPQYPASTRDWTLTVEEKVPVGNLISAVTEERAPLLESIFLIDLYRSPSLGSDKKNITLRFIYRDRNKTVSQAEVEKEHLRLTEKILESLQKESL